jgi:hypothetical protein
MRALASRPSLHEAEYLRYSNGRVLGGQKRCGEEEVDEERKEEAEEEEAGLDGLHDRASFFSRV